MSELTAYRWASDEGWTLEPATVQRDWMDQTLQKAALRCMPLTMANQAGWVIGSPASFKARWVARRADPASLEITFPSKQDEKYKGVILSNFGLGIITFIIPWLFRTSEGIGLFARGPANRFRGDVAPLDGLIETDWAVNPFTMNWKILKPKVDVYFKKGDPICQIIPFPMDLPEQMKTKRVPIENDRKLHEQLTQAARIRHEAGYRGDPLRGKFELTYTRGFRPDGWRAPNHRTNYKLGTFE